MPFACPRRTARVRFDGASRAVSLGMSARRTRPDCPGERTVDRVRAMGSCPPVARVTSSFESGVCIIRPHRESRPGEGRDRPHAVRASGPMRPVEGSVSARARLPLGWRYLAVFDGSRVRCPGRGCSPRPLPVGGWQVRPSGVSDTGHLPCSPGGRSAHTLRSVKPSADSGFGNRVPVRSALGGPPRRSRVTLDLMAKP